MNPTELIEILRLDEWTADGAAWTPPAGTITTVFATLGAESMTINDVAGLRLVGDVVRLVTTRKETYTLRTSTLAVIRRAHAR